MMSAPCVISVADHTGWAYVVCVAVRDMAPVVVERRRVALIDPGLPTLPYHHDTLSMREDEANALIEQVGKSIDARTCDALTRVATELAPTYRAVAFAIREPPFAELPETVAEVWKSYRLQCAADGVMYQVALCRAARQLGLEVHQCRRGDETSRAADQLGVAPGDIEDYVSRRGRPAGPPWTQEHRRAFAAGIAVLAAHTSARMTIPRP